MLKHLCSAGRILLAASISLVLLPIQTPAVVVDLVNGNSGSINGAEFVWTGSQPTGTGYIEPFLRVQRTGVERGYNTSYGTPWDTKAGKWTHELRYSDLLDTKTINGVEYIQFLLDINEQKSGDTSLLALDDVKIFTTPTLVTSPTANASTLQNGGILGTLRYDLDGGGDNRVDLDYSRNPGSGAGDMWMYIPQSYFAGVNPNDYVYFYSKFGGEGYASGAGFEEWAIVPEPATILAGALLVAGLFWRERNRFAKLFLRPA